MDAAIAPESPEETVAASRMSSRALTAREATLTADLDAAYRDTFSGLVVEVASEGAGANDPPTTEPRSFANLDEASFRRLSVEAPAAVDALLKAAQEGDAARWLRFQRDAHRSKLQRDRVSAERRDRG